MFGISGQEFIFWLILAAIIVGPARLPGYVRTVREKVRHFKRAWQLTSQNVDSEMRGALSDIGVDDFSPQKLLGFEDDDLEENPFTPVPPPMVATERTDSETT